MAWTPTPPPASESRLALRNAGGEVGPGVVHRVVAELQRRFILAPDLDLRPRASKYR
jgi:hypothetical protein